MAECKDCGDEIVYEDKKCPTCGTPVPDLIDGTELSKGGIGCGFLILIVFVPFLKFFFSV
jgi:hypothetical protein